MDMKVIKQLLIISLSLGLLSATPAFSGSVLTLMSDSVNSGIINTKMSTDSYLDNIHVDATVVNGVAVFSGVVYSKGQVNELIRIARSVTGIKAIDISRLRIAK